MAPRTYTHIKIAPLAAGARSLFTDTELLADIESLGKVFGHSAMGLMDE